MQTSLIALFPKLTFCAVRSEFGRKYIKQIFKIGKFYFRLTTSQILFLLFFYSVLTFFTIKKSLLRRQVIDLKLGIWGLVDIFCENVLSLANIAFFWLRISFPLWEYPFFCPEPLFLFHNVFSFFMNVFSFVSQSTKN